MTFAQIRSATALALACFLTSCGGDLPADAHNPPQIPAAPAALMAVAGDASATLRWMAAPGARDYAIYRSNTDGGPYVPIADDVTATTYVDTGLTNGSRYFYTVQASNAAGTSAQATQARVTPVSAPAAGSVRWPLSGSTVANADSIRFPYGARRPGSYDFHGGIDLPAPVGTPVHSVMDGVVTARRTDWMPGDGQGSGNFVLVRHGDQKWTAYLHLSSVDVNVGDPVYAGTTKLGEVGDTGANAYHLHLTYMVGLPSEATSESRSKNPLEILPHVALSATVPYDPVATFRNDGSNTVDITLPAHRMTMRWAVLMGGGQTRMLDYYEIVSQGSVARNDQNQPAAPGLHIDASAPPLPDPAGDQNFVLSLRPNPSTDFTVERVVLVDFLGNVILDASR